MQMPSLDLFLNMGLSTRRERGVESLGTAGTQSRLEVQELGGEK